MMMRLWSEPATGGLSNRCCTPQSVDDARRVAANLDHRQTIQTAMGKYEVVRDQRKLWFQDWQGARNLAARTKFEAVNHLDTHLTEFARLLESRGTKVHWASDAQQGRDHLGR